MARTITDSVYCPNCCLGECPALEGDWSNYYEATEEEYNDWQRGGTVTLTGEVYDGFANYPACIVSERKSVTFGPRTCDLVKWLAEGALCDKDEYGVALQNSVVIFIGIVKTQNYGYRVVVQGSGYCATTSGLNFVSCYSCAPTLDPYSSPDPYGEGDNDYPKSIVFGRTFYNYRVCPSNNYVYVSDFQFVPAYTP